MATVPVPLLGQPGLRPSSKKRPLPGYKLHTPLCAEPLLDAIAHVLLITLSPHLAILLFAGSSAVE